MSSTRGRKMSSCSSLSVGVTPNCSIKVLGKTMAGVKTKLSHVIDLSTRIN